VRVDVSGSSRARGGAGAFAIVAFSMLFVCLVVFLPCPDWVRISVVIGPGLIIGIINAITNVYMFKCLSRGATEKGRARALKFAFGLGPIAAMLGSLGAQALLEGRLAALQYPFNFGVLYLIALPCMVVCSFLSSRYKLISVPDEPRSLFFRYLAESFRGYYRDRTLVLAWLSAPAVTTRNLAFLSLATPVASVAPAIYGGLTDHIGFKASFGFGGVMTVLALVFISAIPRAKGRWRRPRPKQPASP